MGVAIQRAGRCTGCGHCCEAIAIPRKNWDWIQEMVAWVATGGTWDPADSQHRDAKFIGEHWHPDATNDGTVDTIVLTCNAYDAAHRSCTRYYERPPVCQGFPWYGETPYAGKLGSSNCGYWLDLPTDEWPDAFDVRALLTA